MGRGVSALETVPEPSTVDKQRTPGKDEPERVKVETGADVPSSVLEVSRRNRDADQKEGGGLGATIRGAVQDD